MEESRGSVDSLQALRISHLTIDSGTSGLHSKISIFRTDRKDYALDRAGHEPPGKFDGLGLPVKV